MLKVKKSSEAVIFVTYYSNSLHMYIFFYVCLWKGACLCLWFWELGLVSEVSLGSGHAFDLRFVLFSELDTSFLHFITFSDHWGQCFTYFRVSPFLTTLSGHHGMYHTYFRVSFQLVFACITTLLAIILSDHYGLYHTYFSVSYTDCCCMLLLTLASPTQFVVACVSTWTPGSGGPWCIGPHFVDITAMNCVNKMLDALSIQYKAYNDER